MGKKVASIIQVDLQTSNSYIATKLQYVLPSNRNISSTYTVHGEYRLYMHE